MQEAGRIACISFIVSESCPSVNAGEFAYLRVLAPNE